MASTDDPMGEKVHPDPGCAPAHLSLGPLAAAVVAQFVGALISYYDSIGRPLPDLEPGGDGDA